MAIADIMTRDQIALAETATSKKRVLELVAELIAFGEPELTNAAVFDELIARERLGSTGLGNGVAIPHCRVARLSGSSGALVVTREPIDFDAMDNLPVNVFFALSVPAESTQDHLQLLAELASMCSDAEFLVKLRAETDPDAVLASLQEWGRPP
jgi:PTS system nitrogen regulatory IIA component